MWRFLLSIPLIIGMAAKPSAQNPGTHDYGALTCHDFVSTGRDNKAVIIWWLRGHHAGKTGVNSFDPKDAYAGRFWAAFRWKFSDRLATARRSEQPGGRVDLVWAHHLSWFSRRSRSQSGRPLMLP